MRWTDVKSYVIDGANFSTLEGFFEEIGSVLIPEATWGRNLDAFNDILRGGFGTPDGGFEFVWRNHALSQLRLGHPETVRELEKRLKRCHPDHRERVSAELDLARVGKGPTVFDWLVEIIQVHGAGGKEAEDGVVLLLR